MDDLIDLLYRAVADEESAACLPAALRDAFGGGSATTFAFDGPSGRPLGGMLTTHSAESGAEYLAYYNRLDPWHAPVMTRIGRPVLGSELIGDDRLARSEFYNDFGRKTGMFHMLILAGPLDGPAAGHFGNLSIHRPEQREPFGEEEAGRIAVLAPHLRRVLALRHALGMRQAQVATLAIEAALDVLPHPAFVTDGHGRVRYANRPGRAAGQLVDRGLLSLRGRSDAPRLRRAIADAAGGGPGGTVLRGSWIVTAGRLPPGFGSLADVSGLVLVQLRPLVEDRSDLARRCVRALGLTQAEAEVVAGIAAGDAPKQVAGERDVGLATVRTLIRRALHKTGCVSLRELTGLALRLPPAP